MTAPISNWTQLTTELGLWLNRYDLTTEIPTFIRLAEAQVERTTRTWQMITRSYAPLQGEYTRLPGDYIELQRARIIGAPTAQKALEYASMGEIDAIQARNPTPQCPTAFNIVGGSLRVAPLPDSVSYTLEILYYARIPKLSAAQSVNWLLADHPDIYLYGSLMQASAYLKNDERVPMWKSAFETGISDLRTANVQGEKGGQPLRARFTPYGARRRI